MNHYKLFVGIFIIFLLPLNFCRAAETNKNLVTIVDVSSNYKYYDDVQFMVGNNFFPLYVDETFQPAASLNYLVSLVLMMAIQDVTLNNISLISYFDAYKKDSKVYPYLQTAVENDLVDSNDQDLRRIALVSDMLTWMKKITPESTVESQGLKEDSSLTREKFLALLRQSKRYEGMKKQYFSKTADDTNTLVGSAVQDFILGNEEAIEKIELSQYQAGNRKLNDLFWEVTLEEDRQYQIDHEDLSTEVLDVLMKRVNRGLLAFYAGRYWESIEACNEVLKVDPTHLNALSLKGSSFYMVQDYKKARKYWQRALKHHPDHHELVQYIQML
jgi:tetratricopeptide (TPR) repeat protein